jgi:hypothetical protein
MEDQERDHHRDGLAEDREPLLEIAASRRADALVVGASL